jgi:acyl-coenzyme A thioesterase 7
MSQVPTLQPVVARLLLPDDANLSGNVHGGTILQLMEQAGMIAATRYFNKPRPGQEETPEHQGQQYAGLARIETMSFHQPVFVGEIASLSTQLLFTSGKSVLIKVTVSAENASTSTNRITNTGSLWYLSFVPQGKREPLKVVSIPQILPPQDDDERALKEYNQAKSLYEARKNEVHIGTLPCLEIDGCLCPKCRLNFQPASPSKTPSESQQMLGQMVLPGDCGTSKIAFGGFVMKLMDTAAGCCAYRHARTNVVTISISSMDFLSMIHLGDIVTLDAKLSFCSAKSMEIQVTARVTSMTRQDHLVAKGTFSFVSLDEKNKLIPVPALKLETEQEFEAAFASQVKYETAKNQRLARKK